MSVILKLLRTLLSYLLFVILVLVLAIPCLIFILLPARWRYDNKLYFWMTYIFYKATLLFSFVPIEFIGKENLPKEPAVFVANHQSALDIPLVGSLMGGFPHIWLAWANLKYYWIGIVISRMTVLIDTTTPMKGMRSLIKAIKMFDGKQRHVIIFPEGGRFIDGNKIHDFFAGFVIIAKRTKRPVIPILILNAYKVYPPGAFFINRYPVRVIIGKPFYFKEGESDDAFKNRVRKWFVDIESKE